MSKAAEGVGLLVNSQKGGMGISLRHKSLADQSSQLSKAGPYQGGSERPGGQA